ncbi:MAG: hypothetical protein ACTHMM_05625 [Agriterribacter sp.]
MEQHALTIEDIQLLNEALEFLPKKNVSTNFDSLFLRGMRAFTRGGEETVKKEFDEVGKQVEATESERNDKITLLRAKLIRMKQDMSRPSPVADCRVKGQAY